MAKQPDRFERVVDGVTIHDHYPYVPPENAVKLLRREHAAVVRAVKKMKEEYAEQIKRYGGNAVAETVHESYQNACDDILAMLTKRKGGGEMKPLFIPLKREFYDAFKRGDKTDELRLYGPRWNHRTCVVGRPVVLSLGYGKGNRMHGTISRFKKQRGDLFGSTYKASIEQVYGTLNVEIACISIQVAP